MYFNHAMCRAVDAEGEGAATGDRVAHANASRRGRVNSEADATHWMKTAGAEKWPVTEARVQKLMDAFRKWE